ncbi:hypothetical protein CR513_47955, partial [Mucuna pruriens]
MVLKRKSRHNSTLQKLCLTIYYSQANDGIYIHQTKYDKELLKKFNFEYCKSMTIDVTLCFLYV